MEFFESQFVSKNIVLAKNGRKCISGRYKPDDENSGMIARPGADFGYVIAMLGYNHEQKLGLTVEDCVKRVYEAVMNLDGSFYLHTDHNTDTTLPYSIGCRHAFQPTIAENANRYGLDAVDVQHAIELCKTNQDMNITMIELSGDHKEKGVFIINDIEHTLNSQDDEHMYFVYDKKRDDLFMKQLIETMGMENVIYEDFQRVSTMQLGVTLQLLAKDLPLFEVDFSDLASPHVRHIGTV